jgi:hypothetical protein
MGMDLENTSYGDFEFGVEHDHAGRTQDDALAAKVHSHAMALLKQDTAHAAKIREYKDAAEQDQVRIAKLEGVLQLAERVLVDGDDEERAEVVAQIRKLRSGGEAWA